MERSRGEDSQSRLQSAASCHPDQAVIARRRDGPPSSACMAARRSLGTGATAAPSPFRAGSLSLPEVRGGASCHRSPSFLTRRRSGEPFHEDPREGSRTPHCRARFEGDSPCGSGDDPTRGLPITTRASLLLQRRSSGSGALSVSVTETLRLPRSWTKRREIAAVSWAAAAPPSPSYHEAGAGKQGVEVAGLVGRV